MAQYLDFQARVRRVVRRGTIYDADIPLYIKDAMKTLENLHNWRHMWRESFQQTLVALDKQVIYSGDVKDVRYLRFVVPASLQTSVLAGRFAYSKKSQPEDINTGFTFTSLHQTRHWLTRQTESAGTILQLNGAFSVDVLYDTGWYLYSDPTSDTNPWYNRLDSGVLLAQVLIEMAPLLRDEKLIARNEALLTRKLAALSESDVIHQFDSDDSEMTPFFEDMQEDLFSQNEGGLP